MTVDELVGSVRKLRVYRNKGQRASYPSIALLWAPGPAQQGALRLTQWPDTEHDLTWLDSATGPSIGSLRRGTASLSGVRRLSAASPVQPLALDRHGHAVTRPISLPSCSRGGLPH